MSNRIIVKEDDTEPPVEATLQDANGDAVDLTNVESVTFQVEDPSTKEVIVDGEAEITDAANGKVKYEWSATDTEEDGDYNGEFDVVYADGSTKTFPNTGYIHVKITRQIKQ